MGDAEVTPESMATHDLEALTHALREAAELLKVRSGETRADARGARYLQEQAQDLLGTARIPLIRLHSFWLDNAVEDVFYNLFGDLPYSGVTEEARRRTCGDLEILFLSLSHALETDDHQKQIECWADFVNSYLDRIHELNADLEGGAR